MLEQLNTNAMTMNKKYALCVDGLSSHFLYFDTFKEWKNDKKRDANDVIFTDTTTYSNLHLFYFAPSTTSTCQPLDGGAFCWLQAKYRAWLNNYLITNNEKPVKKDMIEFVFNLMESLPKHIIQASFRRCEIEVSYKYQKRTTNKSAFLKCQH